jgi:hypothetical protein
LVALIRLRVFEKRVFRRIFGPKRIREQESGESYIKRGLMNCTPCHTLFGRSSRKE